ncbi:hypothetical protein [Boudabousia marimammalium]|uniref:hypothetical protein n=1 Tax=Boudabousia marimammalium TaxID=156892 RepID=UPI000AF9A453|nr:hypothetical protein [Boudabousia marimammalium]
MKKLALGLSATGAALAAAIAYRQDSYLAAGTLSLMTAIMVAALVVGQKNAN